MKNDVHEALCLLKTLLGRTCRADEWEVRGDSPQEAANEMMALLDRIRKLIRGLSHELGRKSAMGILMVLNKIDKDMGYVKLELAYVEESSVAPETMERVDRHAGWKVKEIVEKYGEKIRRCEEHVLATAQERAPQPDGARVEVNAAAGAIVVEGIPYPAEPRQCQIVEALIDANGQRVAASEISALLNRKENKINRDITLLEDEVPPLGKYLAHDGGDGYRICKSVDEAAAIDAGPKQTAKKQPEQQPEEQAESG